MNNKAISSQLTTLSANNRSVQLMAKFNFLQHLIVEIERKTADFPMGSLFVVGFKVSQSLKSVRFARNPNPKLMIRVTSSAVLWF